MKIQFESSTSCNSNCIFCPRKDMTRPQGTMSDELFHKIIKEGKEMGVAFYSPFLNGEPFIFPKIYEWLDYMEKEGVHSVLYTNAEFMDADRLAQYKNIHLVSCSLNAATEETSRKVMKTVDFNKAKANVERLISKAKFFVRVSMVVVKENEHEKELFKQQWHSHTGFTNHFNWPLWAQDKDIIPEKKIIGRAACSHLLNSNITILWDGRVCLCCLDYDGRVILGDMNKESLWRIYKDKIVPLRNRQKKHADFDMPLCRDCAMTKRYEK